MATAIGKAPPLRPLHPSPVTVVGVPVPAVSTVEVPVIIEAAEVVKEEAKAAAVEAVKAAAVEAAGGSKNRPNSGWGVFLLAPSSVLTSSSGFGTLGPC